MPDKPERQIAGKSVTKTFRVGDLVSAEVGTAVRDLSQAATIKGKTRHRVAKIVEKVQVEAKLFEAVNNALVRKYGHQVPNRNDSYRLDPETDKVAEYEREVQEVLDEKVELVFTPVSVSDLLEVEDLEPRVIVVLRPLGFVVDDSEDQDEAEKKAHEARRAKMLAAQERLRDKRPEAPEEKKA